MGIAVFLGMLLLALFLVLAAAWWAISHLRLLSLHLWRKVKSDSLNSGGSNL
jgi:hypothetical protein